MYAKFHRTVLIALLALVYPAASFAGLFGIGVTVGFAPPALPIYVQPPCPAAGYIWTPGYWAYSGDAGDYYWVPGTWVRAPAFGLLWTPGYWRLVDAGYAWNEGYWGPQVGFYGGIDYGFGYFGSGFVGGYWRDRDFYYNRSVTNISAVNVSHVYNRSVNDNHFSDPRPSFNGRNGVEARPTPGELLAARQPRRAMTAPQRFQATAALALPSSRASVNHGHPEIAATAHPGIFQGREGTPTRYANTSPPPAHPTRNERNHAAGPAPYPVRAIHSSSVNRSQPPITREHRPSWQQARQPAHATPQRVALPAARSAGIGVAQSRAPSVRGFPPAPHGAAVLRSNAQSPPANHSRTAQIQRRG